MKPEHQARRTLAEFLQREIGKGSVRAWALQNGLPEQDVRRAFNGSTGMSLDKLQAFADALTVEPWQLLFPHFTRGASDFPTMSREAIDVALELDSIRDEALRKEVYAHLMRGVALAKRSGESGATVQTVEPPAPDPEAMRQRPKVR